MNVSIPIAIPDDYSVTERRIIENAFQDLVDTLRALRASAVNRGAGRTLALQLHLDEALILRGADLEWKARTAVGQQVARLRAVVPLNGAERR